jgi:hypothetical protein
MNNNYLKTYEEFNWFNKKSKPEEIPNNSSIDPFSDEEIQGEEKKKERKPFLRNPFKAEPEFEVLLYSDEFRMNLNYSAEEHNSTVAKTLLKMENNPKYKFQISYIDATPNEDKKAHDDEMVTFIDVNRANRLKEEGKDNEVWSSKHRKKVHVGVFARMVLGEDRFSDRSIDIFSKKYNKVNL